MAYPITTKESEMNMCHEAAVNIFVKEELNLKIYIYYNWCFMKNIVFSCFTPFHLLTAMYYGYKLKNAKRILVWNNYAGYDINVMSLKGLYFDDVVIIPYFLKGNQITRQLRKSLHAGRFFALSKEHKLLSKCENNILIIFSDQEPCSNMQMKYLYSHGDTHVILVEEGTATYYQRNQEYRKILLLIYKILGINSLSRIGLSDEISTVMVRHLDLLDKSRFKCSTFIQQDYFAFDQDFINSLPFLDSIDSCSFNGKKNILFLGQPIEEIPGIDLNEYREFLSTLVSRYYEKYNIIVKPHPRENMSCYENISGLSLIQAQWVPFEVIATRFDYEVIMSLFSSATVNVYEIKPGVKAVYMYKFFKNLSLNDTLFNKYIGLKNIYSPNRFEQLDQLLMSNSEKVDCIFKNNGYDIQYLNKILL